MHIQADGKCAVVSSEGSTIQIPTTNLQTVRRTVKQAYEAKEDQYTENGGFRVKISHHSVRGQCDHCSKCEEQVIGITVGLPNRSVEWEHIENGVKWCEPSLKLSRIRRIYWTYG